MIKRICACMTLLMALATAGLGQVKKVAILPVVDQKNEFTDGVKDLVSGSLTDVLADLPGYQPVDRQNIKLLTNELAFQQSGIVSTEEIQEIGRISGAAYVLIVKLSKIDATHMTYRGQINETKSGDIVNSGTVAGEMKFEAYEPSCAQLVKKLLKVEVGSGGTVSGGGHSNSRPVQQQAANATTASRPAAATSGGRNFTENVAGVSFEMVWVEGGTFQMGCTSEQSGCDNNEKPVHSVTLSGYYIASTLITQELWQKVMGTSVYQQRDKTNTSMPMKGVGANYPMYYVSWDDAMEFCRKLSQQTGKYYTLPTEAQWEYAARGGNKANDQTKYSGSYSADAVAWYKDNSGSSTHEVGRLRANALGIYDMSGNVWEWCRDKYGGYGSNAQTDPEGPFSSSNRVNRGGSWGMSASYCRVSSRSYSDPSFRAPGVGFRVICLP